MFGKSEGRLKLIGVRGIGAAIVLLALGFGLGRGAGGIKAEALDPPARFMPLFKSDKTIMDEPIVYPIGAPAELTTGIVSLMPGDETGWHTHGVPLTGIVLEGELTVDYGARGKRIYRTGDSLAEAISVPHNGRNTGDGVMRLFAVFIGAKGVPMTTPVKN